MKGNYTTTAVNRNAQPVNEKGTNFSHLSTKWLFCIMLLLGMLSTGFELSAQTTSVFTYTGSNQTFVVPTGVTSLTVRMWGAGGGGASGGGSGGSGAFVKGTLAVSAGQTLYMVVGGGGNVGGTATYGNGGAGGTLGTGGSGGGGTGIFLNSVTFANARVVAGGGGGSAYGPASGTMYGGAGGATSGTAAANYNANYTGGGGATASAGGAASKWNNNAGNVRSGPAGTALTGASAATGYDYGGGGGGGGYYGGGAGYSSNSETFYNSGGGGGSSYTTNLTAITNTAGVTNTSGATTQAPGNGETGFYVAGVGNGGANTGAAGGNGLITITYTLPGCSGTPTPGNTVASVNPVVSGSTTVLSLQSPTGAGATYQWRFSSDGINYSNVASGGTSATYTATITSDTYYKCNVTCSGNTGTSNAVLVNVILPPANDTCANATVLSCGTNNLAGTTVASVSETAPKGLSSNYGVWYSFTGDGNSTTISATTTVLDIKLAIFSATACGATYTTVANVDGPAVGTETFTFSSVNGTKYFVYIAYYDNAGTAAQTGTFTISRTCTSPPPNDICDDAAGLPCGTSNLGGTTVNSVSEAPPGGLSSNYGVWYTFKGDGANTIISATTTSLDIRLLVFSAAACGGPYSNVANVDAVSTGTETTPSLSTVNGTTYFVYIAYYDPGSSTATGTFTISRTCSPGISPSVTSLPGFIQASGTPSDEQTFTVNGASLTAGVVVTVPANYEISTTSGTYTPGNTSVTLAQSGGVLTGQPVSVYVRLNAASSGTYNGNITLTSTSATTRTITITGSTAAPTYDLSVTALTAPANSSCFTASENVTFQITNSGNILWDFTANPRTISGTITNGTPASFGPVSLTGTLAAGASMTVTVTTLTNMRTPQTYTFTGTLDNTNESGPGASSVNDSFSVARISANPTVSLSSNTPVCAGSPLILTAVNSGGNTVATNSGSKSESPGTIPDNNTAGLSSVIALGGNGTVSASSVISVTLNIGHTYLTDLDIYLVGPGNCGTLELSTDNGAAASAATNYNGTVLSTSATTNINTVSTSPIGAGPYRPEGTITGTNTNIYSLPTAALNGCAINGNWTLRVFDDAGSDTGSLSSWNLSISATGNYSDAFTGAGIQGAIAYSGTSNATAIVNYTNPTTSTYSVITTDASGCASAPATTSVTVNAPATPTGALTIVNSTCASACTVTGGSIALGTVATTNGTLEYSTNGGANWSATLPTYDAPQTILASSVIGACRSSSFQVGTTVAGTCTTPAAPIGSLSITNSTCASLCTVSGGSIAIGSVSGPGGTLEYSTDNGLTWSSALPTYDAPQIIIASVLSPAGCRSNTTSVGSTVAGTCTTPAAPTGSLSITNSTCASACTVSGGSIALGTVTGSGGTLQYSTDNGGTWSSGLPAYNAPQTILASVINGGGCRSISFQVGTTVAGTCTTPATPTITADGPTTFCEGGSVVLTSSAGTTYLWSTGATTQSITVAATGNYTVQVSNASGCQSASSAAAAVTVTPQPFWYLDTDGDHYYSIATQSCTSPGAGYTQSGIVGGGDCDDTVAGHNGVPGAEINPGHEEVCWNNVDDNCNTPVAILSEGCTPVVVNITASYNGSTMPSLSTAISAVAYTYPGTTNIKYRFSITNVTTGTTAADVIQTSRFVTIPASIHLYGATYTIKASAVINDEVVPFAGNTITVTAPTVQLITLSSGSCGATLALLTSTISANAGLNAVDYTFRIRLNDGSTTAEAGPFATAQSNTRFIGANSFTGFPLQYSSSYKVSVQYSFVDSEGITVQSGYGPECTINTPSIPVISIASPTEGFQVAGLNSGITATSASYATAYQFRIRLKSDNGANPNYRYTAELASRFSSLTAFGTPPFAYNTEYVLSVRYRVAGPNGPAWSGYGPDRTFKTPFFPVTNLVTSQCGLTTSTSLTQQLEIVPYPGYPNYRVLLEEVNGELVLNSQEIVVAYSHFRLNQFSIAQVGKRYSISVAIKLNGEFGTYETACDVNTLQPGGGGDQFVKTTIFKAMAYPNPFANNFMLDVKTTSQSSVNLKVYDMLGRLIENKNVSVSDMETTTIGDQYPSGVYNVIVSQEDNVQTVRVIKR